MPSPDSDENTLLDARAWRAIAPGGTELKLAARATARGPALRLEYDFHDAGGFVIAQRDWRRALPPSYTVRLRVRGNAPANHLEIKLIDTSGRNVWRHTVRDFAPGARWRRLSIPSREFPFAWGPASGSRLEALGRLEFGVVARAGSGGGGRGTLEIADLEIVADVLPEPRCTASSECPDGRAADALGANGWRPDPQDPRPWLEIDAGVLRTMGGLVIDWHAHAPAAGLRLRASNTGRRWKTVHAARRCGGARSDIDLPGLHARRLRLELNEPSAGARIALQPFDYSSSPAAFWQQVARAHPRGWHPRWLLGEQSLWTAAGNDHGHDCALMNTDGMVEAQRAGHAVEPMLWVDGLLHTWAGSGTGGAGAADAAPRPGLAQGWQPQPEVVWERPGWRLHVALSTGSDGVPRIDYRLDNLGAAPLAARLFVLLRPFQVSPPWQGWRDIGGVHAIRALAWRDGMVEIDGAARVLPLAAPAGFGAQSFAEGCIVETLARGALPERAAVQDPAGRASGALRFDLAAAPGASAGAALLCLPAGADARAAARAPRFDWNAAFDTGHWSGAGWAQDAIASLSTATAHVLVTRAGPALQPGPRRYTRAWIRDGATMGAALLRMGRADVVCAFIDWYIGYQRADGFVPCCVDGDGPDWLVEHDSHGELVALVADHYRFSRDAAALARHWPALERALACIEGLLDDTGLLPISASHEGYLAQPVHAYWDDFWALRALRDGAALARATGRAALAERWQALEARFAAALVASIEATRAAHGLDFVPGSAELHDFDPTATANAVALVEVPAGLDRAALERGFDHHLELWRARRDGTADWANYTPYEIRLIGALVRLGRRADALDLLRYFLAEQRPPAWHQWPEIAWRDPAAPAHLGDLPHTWIAAEYVLAVRALFVYESEEADALVLGAGLAPEWLEGDGVRVRAAPTAAGPLSYRLRRLPDAGGAGNVDDRDGAGATLVCQIEPGVQGALLLRPPLAGVLRAVELDGRPHADFDAHGVRLAAVPARLVLTLHTA